MDGKMPRHLVIESQFTYSPTLFEPHEGEYLSRWSVYDQGKLVAISAEFTKRDSPETPARVVVEHWDIDIVNRVHVEGDIENPGEP